MLVDFHRGLVAHALALTAVPGRTLLIPPFSCISGEFERRFLRQVWTKRA